MNRRIIHMAVERTRQKSATLIANLLVALLCIAGFTGYAADAVSAEGETPRKTSRAKTDFERIEGHWVRPDGAYILELPNIKKDGSISAAYFNPRPIKVFRAKAGSKGGRIILVVELRDVNYPGSTYTLQYDAASDRLKGTYFQAVHRQTFDIEFVRTR
jgi:hypothetical protein